MKEVLYLQVINGEKGKKKTINTILNKLQLYF